MCGWLNPWTRNLRIRRASCTTPFSTRDWSMLWFWYPREILEPVSRGYWGTTVYRKSSELRRSLSGLQGSCLKSVRSERKAKGRGIPFNKSGDWFRRPFFPILSLSDYASTLPHTNGQGDWFRHHFSRILCVSRSYSLPSIWISILPAIPNSAKTLSAL